MAFKRQNSESGLHLIRPVKEAKVLKFGEVTKTCKGQSVRLLEHVACLPSSSGSNNRPIRESVATHQKSLCFAPHVTPRIFHCFTFAIIESFCFWRSKGSLWILLLSHILMCMLCVYSSKTTHAYGAQEPSIGASHLNHEVTLANVLALLWRIPYIWALMQSIRSQCFNCKTTLLVIGNGTPMLTSCLYSGILVRKETLLSGDFFHYHVGLWV